MGKLNKQELRRMAEAAISGDWFEGGDLRYSDDKTGEVHGLNVEDERFIAAANPAAILSLLDELEENDGVIAVWRGRTQRAEAELEQYRKDAERYRWLRGRLPGSSYRIAGVIYSEGGEGVDEAIDAAMAKEGGSNV